MGQSRGIRNGLIAISVPALKFDGKDDYLEIPHSDTVNVGENDFTLVAWLNPATPGDGKGIISKGAWCWNGGWILDIGDTGPGAIPLGDLSERLG